MKRGKQRQRLLIVGGTGYFGARLAAALQPDHDVILTQRTTSVLRSEWIARTGLQVLAYDSAHDPVLPLVSEVDAVINLAAPGAAEAANDPEAARARALATVQACVQCLDAEKAARLVHFSTFHVYGAGGRVQFAETDAPSPIHPYGEIHLACEQALQNDPRAWRVRPTNLVGAPAHGDLGSQARLLFLDLCRQAASGAMKLHNDGQSFRDFLPFDDAIQAVKHLLAAPAQPERLFNLASGTSMRLDAVASLIQGVAHPTPSVELGAGHDAFRAPFTVTTERLRHLGWEPQASLADEARAMVQFFS